MQSWLLTKQFKFAYTVPRTIEQFISYRNAKNLKPSGEKLEEKVFKLKDELPDCARYIVMGYPELPDPDRKPMSDEQQKRLAAFPPNVIRELERMEEIAKRKKDNAADLQPNDDGFGYKEANWFLHDDMSL